jgi:hypothetical protein
MRSLHLYIIALLAGVHALVVPVHVALDHGPFAMAAACHGGHVQTVCPCDDTGADDCAPALERQWHDASGECQDHHHEAHAHALTDHGYVPTRIALAAALLPAPCLLAAPAVPASAPRQPDSPVPLAPDVGVYTLRGPPRC